MRGFLAPVCRLTVCGLTIWRLPIALLAAILLAACGGGGGGGVAGSGPPTLSGAAARLFSPLAGGQNLTEASFAADTDSGQITVFDNRAMLTAFLAKQPDASRFIKTGPQTDQARLVFIPANSGAANPASAAVRGRYLLWGQQLTRPPASGDARYIMAGSFVCPGCQLPNGALSGELQISFATGRTQISPTGQGFSFRTLAELGKSGSLTALANHQPSLILDEVVQPVTSWRLRGGLFGSGGETAGLVFGLDSAKGPVTGAVLGGRSK